MPGDGGLQGPGTLVTRQPVSRVPCYCSWVMKKTSVTRRSKTHFEQIPVAAVRTIARNVVSTEREQPTRRDNLRVEPSTTKREPYSLQRGSHYRNATRHR